MAAAMRIRRQVAAPGRGQSPRSPQDLPAGARLIELPRRCLLTYDPSDCDPGLLALIGQVPEELWGGRLALALLAHRAAGPSSPFAPYIAQLPRGFPGVPMFFSREALEAIDYPPVVEQVKKRCRWLHRFSTDALAPLAGTAADPFGGVRVDINSLGWGLAAVTSRAFRVRGPSQPASLLPLIDMANHSFEPNAEVLPAEDGGVAMVAKRQLRVCEWPWWPSGRWGQWAGVT
ncbi:hypothetical protein MNEG_10760 [Monoraphidium neglectum]|uniref:Uncharacterized protein n=1 Tax=Monoraphidium neglectum TaxID=145388 RepID=A0A0D2KNK5_9CHLO|nr:hypothetical protein MNEG_10760 [Monoraphidium neglectum]KIY97203.1 hypothetical protein MNEG_10760 [Monoraphidium neglectum]|eukprot:XP_013896223.1 hypothetical protein MNEG_10760 [Monoraphidium neglectum]